MSPSDLIFIDDLYLEDLERRRTAKQDFLAKLKKLLWNVAYFQRPIYSLRQKIGLDPFFGVSPDNLEREKAYEEFYFQGAGSFPARFEEGVDRICQLLQKHALIDSTKTSYQFIRAFSYFGLLDVNPDLPIQEVELPDKEYICVDSGNGKRSFRYQSSPFGIFVEICPSHRIEDIESLFQNEHFNTVRFAASGGEIPTTVSRHELTEVYRALFLAICELGPMRDKEFLHRVNEDPTYRRLKIHLDNKPDRLKHLREQARAFGYIK